MSIADYRAVGADPGCGVPTHPSNVPRPLHRLAEARRMQGVSRRTVARRLKSDVSTVKSQEDSSSDISLSELYQWQRALQVPIGELLVEADDDLSPPILKRAQFIRLMKTAMAILERSQQPGIRRMAGMLVEQLVEIMPELAEVGPWHAVGKRRTQEELGAVVNRRLSREALADLMQDSR